jgi:hypothetical protein
MNQRQRETAIVESWHRSPAYADLQAALAEHGYASYEQARAHRLASATDAEKARYEAMQRDWTRRMMERAGVAPTLPTPKRAHGKRAHVKRGPAKVQEPIPAGHLAAMRARLDEALAPGRAKGRRPTGTGAR